jgi:hypothetical protein
MVSNPTLQTDAQALDSRVARHVALHSRKASRRTPLDSSANHETQRRCRLSNHETRRHQRYRDNGDKSRQGSAASDTRILRYDLRLIARVPQYELGVADVKKGPIAGAQPITG